jgi:Family of unknown function (DUF5771)
MSCPPGEIRRKSYTRKGKRIAASCIRSTSSHKQSSANFRKQTAKRMSIRLRGPHKGRTVKCATGKLARKPYVRVLKTGKRVYVPSACIPDKGRPGKRSPGTGIGPLHKGELTKFGYKAVKNLTVAERHASLAKAVAHYGSLATWRKVNALYVYLKNTSPELSKKYDEDRKWIQKTYGLKAL